MLPEPSRTRDSSGCPRELMRCRRCQRARNGRFQLAGKEKPVLAQRDNDAGEGLVGAEILAGEPVVDDGGDFIGGALAVALCHEAPNGSFAEQERQAVCTVSYNAA